MKEDIVSPNHDYSSYEVRMSHWIDQPYLIRVSDNVCLFDLNAATWSASTVRWLDESTVELYVRKYPGLIDCTLVLNILTNHATATSRANSFSGTFPAVSDWVLRIK